MEKYSLSWQEITDIVALFPGSWEDPKIYQEVLDKRWTPMREWIVVEEGSIDREERKIDRKALFYLCRRRFLSVRFIPMCRESCGWMEQRWKKSLDEKRTVVCMYINIPGIGKKPFYQPADPHAIYEGGEYFVLKSKNPPVPEGVEPSEWKKLIAVVLQEYRNYLHEKKPDIKAIDVELNTEPIPPKDWIEEREENVYPLQECVIDGWKSVGAMLIGNGTVKVPQHELLHMEWEIQKTEECHDLLEKERLKAENPHADIQPQIADAPYEEEFSPDLLEKERYKEENLHTVTLSQIDDTSVATSDEEFIPRPNDRCQADMQKRRLTMARNGWKWKRISDWEKENFKDRLGEGGCLPLKERDFSTTHDAIRMMVTKIIKENN